MVRQGRPVLGARQVMEPHRVPQHDVCVGDRPPLPGIARQAVTALALVRVDAAGVEFVPVIGGHPQRRPGKAGAALRNIVGRQQGRHRMARPAFRIPGAGRVCWCSGRVDNSPQLATFVTLASIQLALRRLARAQVVMMTVCKAWDSRPSPTPGPTAGSRRKRTRCPKDLIGIRPARFLQIQWVDMSSRFAVSDTKYAFENPRTLTLTMPDFSTSTAS